MGSYANSVFSLGYLGYLILHILQVTPIDDGDQILANISTNEQQRRRSIRSTIPTIEPPTPED